MNSLPWSAMTADVFESPILGTPYEYRVDTGNLTSPGNQPRKSELAEGRRPRSSTTSGTRR